MMGTFWSQLCELGVHEQQDTFIKRYVSITNQASFIVSVFVFIIFIAGLFFFGWIPSLALVLASSFLWILPIVLNSLGKINTSRVMASVMLSLMSLGISVVDKFDFVIIENFQYFQFRMMLVSSSIFPFIIFRLQERKQLLTALTINILCLIIYDPIHILFGVGYFDLNMNDPNYYFLNFVFVACYLIIAGCTFFLKGSFEKAENENVALISALSKREQELLHAKQIIEKQSDELTIENVSLNQELITKNDQLTATNAELIRHNNELQQFSYTVSHNLRGPVASLLGLINLTNANTLSEDHRELVEHQKKAIASLDATIRDLGNIIDIRNAVSKVKQQVRFQEELDHIITLLQREVEKNNVSIDANFDNIKEIYSVRPMVSSILYNLISNAIKYRSPERKLKVSIKTERVDSFVKISVSDNGLGLDINRFKEKLFGLYKRFHTHVDGKGLGLFLVKLQSESLGGRVEIDSELGVGSTFNIYLADTINPDHQIIMDKEWGKLFYDATEDTAYVIWKRALTLVEFKEFFQRCIDYNNTQPCNNWIVIINEGTKAEKADEEYDKARMDFINEMKRSPLKQLAYVIARENEPEDYENYKKKLINFYQGRIKFFNNLAEGKNWIQQNRQK
jgi:signal transduction histidine kinase